MMDVFQVSKIGIIYLLNLPLVLYGAKCPPNLLAKVAAEKSINQEQIPEVVKLQISSDREWLNTNVTQRGLELVKERLRELSIAIQPMEQKLEVQVNNGPKITIVRQKTVLNEFSSPFSAAADNAQYLLSSTASEAPVAIILNGIQQVSDFERGFFGLKRTENSASYGARISPGLIIDALLTKDEKEQHWKGYTTHSVNLGN